MGVLDRFGSALSRAGTALQRFGRVPAAVDGLYPVAQQQVDRDTPKGRILRSMDALFGRTTYGAGPSLTRWSSYPASGLNPEKINSALKAANNGYPLIWAELCEQVLERDAHLAGIDDARRREVSGKPFRVQPRNETPLAQAVAKFVEAIVREIDALEFSIENLLGANAQGWSAAEIIWRFEPVRFLDASGKASVIQSLCPSSLEWVHPKHFEFGMIDDERFLVFSGERHTLPANKFVFHAATGAGLIERRGFMRQCVWLHAAKQWALRDWLTYCHLFGIPQIQGVYNGDQSLQDDQRSEYQTILEDFGQGIPAITSNDFKIDVKEFASGGKSGDVHGAIVGMANAEMSKRVNASTLTTEMGQHGSYGAADTHADVRHGIVRADANKLARTLREDLFLPIIKLNLEQLSRTLGASPDEVLACVPWLHWRIDRETSPQQRAGIISTAINEWGLAVDEDSVRDEFAIDAPRSGSKPLAGKPQAIASGGAVVGSLEAAREGAENPKPETQPTKTDAPPSTK